MYSNQRQSYWTAYRAREELKSRLRCEFDAIIKQDGVNADEIQQLLSKYRIFFQSSDAGDQRRRILMIPKLVRGFLVVLVV